jgi:uncharacterized phage protein gp47/JayE
MPVTPSGFVVQTTDDFETLLEQGEQAAFGAGVNTSSTSVFGQLNSIMADQFSEMSEVLEDLSNSFDPETATGSALDAICALTGVVRFAPTYSKVTLTVNLNAGTTLTIGRIVSAAGNPSVKFTTIAAVTNSGGSAANFNVDAWATVTGPVFAAAGSLTTIETPVTGWNSVTNAADAILGTNLETDSALRSRRQLTLQATGSANAQAIRADVLEVAGVTQAAVFENATDTTDVNSVPPHAFETVVQGGAQIDIANAIWGSKPIGIATYGSVSQNITDYSGTTQTVNFSRPTLVPIYVSVSISVNASYLGDTTVKQAIATYFASFLLDQDVVTALLYPIVLAVQGVTDVQYVHVGTAPSPTLSTNIPITSRQLATNLTTNDNVTIV